MKYQGLLLSGIIIIFIGIIASCGGKVTPSLDLQQKAAQILDQGSPWGGTGNVEVLASPSGVDPSDLLGLQLNFSTSGEDDWAPEFFDASGADDYLSTNNSTWVWSGSGTDLITLTEASVAEFTSVDVVEESITVTFEVNDSNSGSRITGIDGSYTLKLQ